MIYDIQRQHKAGNYVVFGNGRAIKVLPTYRAAIEYVHSDEFAKACPIWTPASISLLVFFGLTIAVMIALGVR
jgi:hypothetical protein